MIRVNFDITMEKIPWFGLKQWYSTWAILWFIRFGGRLQFPGGDFCRL